MLKKVSSIIFSLLMLCIISNNVKADSISTSQPKTTVTVTIDEGIEVNNGDKFIISCINNETNEKCNAELCITDITGVNYLEFPDIGIYKINDIAYMGDHDVLNSVKYAITEYVAADWDSTEEIHIGIGEEQWKKLKETESNIIVISKRSDAIIDNQDVDVINEPGSQIYNGETDIQNETTSDITESDSETKITYYNTSDIKDNALKRITRNLTLGAVLTLVGIIVLLVMKKKGMIK